MNNEPHSPLSSPEPVGSFLQERVNAAIISSEGVKVGPRTAESYLSDPKHLLFNLSRYKFVSKMFAGLDRVLEIGCGDGFGTALVAREVKKLTATDIDARFIEDTQKTHPYADTIDFVTHDMTHGPIGSVYDGAFSLDVLEHIDKKEEFKFMTNIVKCLKSDSVCIIGAPSLESQIYASELSKLGHVNCKTAPDLKTFMENFFHRVFIFSMNDEVLHTGFYPMAHYLFALGVLPRQSK
jgi:2-polyprenyl-3-methyl-5-hydroxy-6-metoxy-1,4-benzoquinol methylase